MEKLYQKFEIFSLGTRFRVPSICNHHVKYLLLLTQSGQTDASLDLKEMAIWLSETCMAKESWDTSGWFCCVSDTYFRCDFYCELNPGQDRKHLLV